ncbi:MAG: hypothetical protein JO149_02085, partial [Gammaproteobacteria bacterium]|nr:hypothetical protein [Gammaproteobacteria bacterium]
MESSRTLANEINAITPLNNNDNYEDDIDKELPFVQVFMLEYSLYRLLNDPRQSEDSIEAATLKDKIQKQLPKEVEINDTYFVLDNLKKRLEKKAGTMLKIAYNLQHTKLRDVALCIEDSTFSVLLECMTVLWRRLKISKDLIELKTASEYLLAKFLLASNFDFPITKTIWTLAATIDVEMLVLLLDYQHRLNIPLPIGHLENLLKEQVDTYLKSHAMDVLYKRDYLKNPVRQLCKNVLKLNDIELSAVIGDESELENQLKNPANSLENALWQACYFNRVAIADRLINAGANVNVDKGKILYQAVVEENVEIIRLLLNCKKIDVALMPVNAKKNIY